MAHIVECCKQWATWGGSWCFFSWFDWLVNSLFISILTAGNIVSSSHFFSASHVLMLLSFFRLLGTLEYPGVNHPSLCWGEKPEFVGLCCDEVGGFYCRARCVWRSGSSGVCWSIGDCCRNGKGLPCDVAVGPSQLRTLKEFLRNSAG